MGRRGLRPEKRNREGGDRQAMQHDTTPSSRQPPSVQIRRALESDAASLAHFMAALVGERLPVLFRRDRSPTVDEEVEFIRQFEITPRSVLFVAATGGEIVGMLDFCAHPHPQRSHAGEFGMSVAKAWRGKGIGAQLLEHLMQWARSQRLRRMELSVFSNNLAALALCERTGFLREGVQRDAVEVDGRYVDIVLMARTV